MTNILPIPTSADADAAPRVRQNSPPTLRKYLPAVIDIPADDYRGDDDDDDDDGLSFKPLAKVTLADLDAHLRMVAPQLDLRLRRYQALRQLRDLAVANGATADSLALAALVGEAS